MKKIFLLLVMFVSFELSAAHITAKVIPSDNLGFLIFSDGSYWKVTTFVKRYRGPLEWLSGAELFVPENYLCNLKDWCYGDEFDVYLKQGNVRADESAASNQEEIKEYTHLLVNPRTEKILFGIPLNPDDFMAQIFNKGFDLGYGQGYSRGYELGSKSLFR